MEADAGQAVHEQSRESSGRLRLARVAHDAALGVPGVLNTDAGPLGLRVTAAAGQRVPGVVCAASGEDGYEVSLSLIAELVPLPQLGDRVAAAVRHAASAAGVPLGRVLVNFVGVLGSEDGDANA
ncbi:MAG: hypothetical protein WAK93_04785 [Solirubrobacteraceae bacterium]